MLFFFEKREMEQLILKVFNLVSFLKNKLLVLFNKYL